MKARTSWKEQFRSWLARQGAEVLPSTNAYEVARFRARGGVHVVYEGRRGFSAEGFALECLRTFQDNPKSGLDMGLVKTLPLEPREKTKIRQSLLDRDGRLCFYCIKPMPDHDITIEHLIPLQKGGPNIQDNFVLAHGDCNLKSSNLPLVEKIKMRTDAVFINQIPLVPGSRG